MPSVNKNMTWRIILWPLSLPYRWVSLIRNLFFDWAWLPSKSYPLPIICVGNLSTGGTGKTPMTEFILKHIHPGNGAMVSRGYGRKTKGLVLAQKESTALEIGDEPFQIYQKFPNIKMALAEKRTLGIEAILKQGPSGFIVLDDAYQHRHVKASFYILLSTFQDPFYSDFVLPAGNLRESRSGSSRADILVFTKCPKDLSRKQADVFKNKISKKEVYFSSIQYGKALNFLGEDGDAGQPFLAITGIAQPKPFLEHIKQHYQIEKHQKFSDHHSFTETEIAGFKDYLNSNPDNQIISTEKDWVRLKDSFEDEFLKRIFYLPIELKILFDEEAKFKSKIEDHIQTFKF